jgi:exosome complex component RRP40
VTNTLDWFDRTRLIFASSRLLNPKHPVLPALSVIPFETAIGLNGRIWIKAQSVNQTIALKRVLEGIDAGEIRAEKTTIEKAVKALL